MAQLEIIRNKIFELVDFDSTLSFYRFKDMKIVFTNGCFDILHRGHIEYLAKARDLGDKLIVGLNTDTSVKRLKGKDRPINDQDTRAMNLASIKFVDSVIYFEEDTPLELIKAIKPNVLTKGSDYEVKDIVGAEDVIRNGGIVETIDLVEGFSTTTLINKQRT